MNRRLLSILLPVAAASLVAGCSTFDTDVVARVGDEELTVEQLDELLLGIGATEEDLELALPALPVRDTISNWINTTASGQVADIEPISAAEVNALYDQGLEAAGVSCPQIMLTETFELAESAADRIRSGEDFVDLFTELNIEPALVETNGIPGCFSIAQLGTDLANTSDGVALLAVNADNPVEVAEFPTQTGIVGFLVVQRDFASLSDNENLQVTDAITSTVGPRRLLESLDVYVDPRYGTFDTATGAVVAIG